MALVFDFVHKLSLFNLLDFQCLPIVHLEYRMPAGVSLSPQDDGTSTSVPVVQFPFPLVKFHPDKSFLFFQNPNDDPD